MDALLKGLTRFGISLTIFSSAASVRCGRTFPGSAGRGATGSWRPTVPERPRKVRALRDEPRDRKIEILGPMPGGDMLFKYHQAKIRPGPGSDFHEALAPGQAWLAD